MPSLKQVTCSVEYGPENTALKEYQRRYHDGVVESFICIPPSDLPFNIHVKSRGYIAPGLAVFVFMDGEYQCNRNRNNLKDPDAIPDPKHFEVDFRLRQKEEKKSSGGFVGREWTFSELDTGKADAAESVNSRFLNNVGTIEVVILRCKARHGTTESNVAKSTKLSEPKPPPSVPPPPRAKSSRHESPVADNASDAFGGMFGLFDGACDDIRDIPQLDGPYDGRRSAEYGRSYQDEGSLDRGQRSRLAYREDNRRRNRSPRRYESPPPRRHRAGRVESESRDRNGARYRYPRVRSPCFSETTMSDSDRHRHPRRYDTRYEEADDRETRYMQSREHEHGDKKTFSKSHQDDRRRRDDRQQMYCEPEFHYAQPYGMNPWRMPDALNKRQITTEEEAEIEKMRQDCSAMYAALMDAGTKLLQMNQEIYALEMKSKSASSEDRKQVDIKVSELKTKRAASDSEQKQKFKEWHEADTKLRKRDEEVQHKQAAMPTVNHQRTYPYAAYYPPMPGYFGVYRPEFSIPGQWPTEVRTVPGAPDESAQIHWADPQYGAEAATCTAKPDDKPKEDAKTETAAQPETKAWANAGDENKPESNNDIKAGSTWANNDGDKKDVNQRETTTTWGNGDNNQQSEGQNENSGWDNSNNDSNNDSNDANNNNDSNNDNSGGDSWNTPGNTDGAGNWDESGDNNKGGDNWNNTSSSDDNKKKEPSNSADNKSERPPTAHSHHSNDTSSSTAPGPKPYWSEWQCKVTTTYPDPEPRRRARDPYHYDAPERVPAIKPKDSQITHAVRSGKGASYTHETHRPDYLDTLSKPYAVFSFKYRSKKALEKILGKSVEEPIDRKVEKERMMGMSKEELIEEMLRRGGGSVGSEKKERKGERREEGGGWGGGSAAEPNKRGSKKEGNDNGWGASSSSGTKKSVSGKADGWGGSAKSASQKKDAGWAGGTNAGSTKENKDSGGGGGWAEAGGGETGGGGANYW